MAVQLTSAESAQMRDRYLLIGWFKPAATFAGFEFVDGPLTLDQAMQAVKDGQVVKWLEGVYDVAAWQLEGGAV